MFRANLWCYLWDLVDEGIDTALDIMQGQLGATGLSVATSYHSVEQLRPHAGVSPRIFRCEGGLNFQPASARYAATRLKPVVASWLGKRNPLERLASACQQRRMELRGWTVCCHSSLLVRRYPQMACKDVFGSINPTWLCPANPDVAEYLKALVADLSENYPFDAIELESATFDPARHAHMHRKAGLVAGPAEQLLLGLCFCESCRQQADRAGVDVTAVARSVHVRLERWLETGRPVAGSMGELLESDALLREMLDWRTEVVGRLVASLRAASRSKLVIYRMGDAWSAGADWRRLFSAEGRDDGDRQADALMILCYKPDVPGVEAAVADAVAITGGVEFVELGFDASPPATPDAPKLVRDLSRAAELGIGSVNIYHYGLIPPGRFAWVRQAIRAGRRVAEL